MTAILALTVLSGTACNRYHVIPETLEGQVNEKATFQTVQASPQSYKGELVVWGGEVLKATRLEKQTRLEVLQLPLTDDLVPAADRAESKGRFIAYDRQGDILDPAVVQEGTKVTIVGPVLDPLKTPSDAGREAYPVIGIRDMTVWDKKMSRAWAYPYYGPYYGHYYYGYRPYVFWDGTRVQSAAIEGSR